MTGSLGHRLFVRGAWFFALPLLLVAEPRLRVVEPAMDPIVGSLTVETASGLDQLAHRAALAAKEAEALRALVEDSGSRISQRNLLSNIERLANAMGEDLCRLHAVSGVMNHSDQTRVDYMAPDIVELADKTDAALLFLGENTTGFAPADYRGFATEIHEDALRIQQVAAGQAELTHVSAVESENNYHIAADYCGF